MMQTVSSVFWKQMKSRETDLIVNRIRMDMVESGNMMSMDDVVEILAIDTDRCGSG